MSDKTDKPVSRRGFLRYDHNPSVSQASSNTRTGVKRISNKAGDKFMIISEHGEVIAPAAFHEVIEVDRTQFVKLYISGVKAFQGLTAAGTKVFEIIYRVVQQNPGVDRFYLHFMEVQRMGITVSERTFHRGMSELLEKSFIYESITPNMYFLNIDYLFNGDRLAFVKEYHLASITKAIQESTSQSNQSPTSTQGVLPLGD
jgi:hypothetical protein